MRLLLSGTIACVTGMLLYLRLWEP